MPILVAAQDPDDGTLLRVLRHLDGKQDAIGVVRLVERWAETSTVPVEARISEARALLKLRLMDRAWVRLRELTDGESAAKLEVEALLLMAEMFVERGWPARARKTLVRLPEGSADVPEGLRTRASAAPLQPPPNARELERTGSDEEILALAERYLATGSVIRGRSLLERLRRGGSQEARVEELLRALRGDFGSRSLSMAELIAELCPPGSFTEWDIADHTESIRLADLGAADPPTAELRKLPLERAPAGGAFPTLFRRDPASEATGQGGEEAEVTVSSHMASGEELVDPPPEAASGPQVPLEPQDDTRIMQVIQRKDGSAGLEAVEGPIHRKSEKKDRLRETLDLRAYQESMGMSGLGEGAGSAPEVEEDFLEEEDQDLVVMTRREEPAAVEADAPRSRRGPIEVIEKHPIPNVPPAPAPAGPSPGNAAPPGSAEVDSELEEAPGTDLRVLAIAAVVLLVVAVLAALFAYRMVVYLASNAVEERVRPALAAGDYRGLLDLEAELEQRLSGGLSPATASSELAHVEAVLWSEYTGDARRHQRALELLHEAEASGARPSSLARARVSLALAEGDLVGARALAGPLETGDEASRYLLARIALAEGEADQASELWPAGYGSGLRHRLLSVDLAFATGGEEAGEEAMGRVQAAAEDNPLVVVASLEQGARDPLGVLEGSESWLEAPRSSSLGPRQQARLHLARAAAQQAQGQEQDAVASAQLARSVDGDNPSVRYALGATALARNDVLGGLADFDACLEVRQSDARCARGAVQALLDLDRLVEARARVEGWPGAGEDRGVLLAWIALQEGSAPSAHEALARARALRGVETYVRALGSGEGEILVRASEELARARDPLDQVLAVRAEAAGRLLVPGTVSARELASLAERGMDDPVVQIMLGRYHESRGRASAASAHFDRAGEIGPQNAWALHERGLYYFAPPYVLARASWRQYLSLEPSGARAERVRQRLALR